VSVRAAKQFLGYAPLLAVLACGSSGGDEAEVEHRVPVTIEPEEAGSLEVTEDVVGRLATPPGGEATLTAPADGVIRNIRVQVGQSVGRGQSLLTVDVPDLQAQARSQRAQSVAAEREAERQRELLAEGVTSRKQLEEATAAATAAAAAADAAERLLERTTISAPIAGSIQQIMVNTGEQVQTGTPLIQVVNGRTLTLVATVAAPTHARLRTGMDAWVRVEGVADSVEGSIEGVSPGVDTTTNAGTVVIRIRHQPPTFRPGAGASARVGVGSLKDVLLVPDSALVVLGATNTIFVVQPDSTVKAIPVQVQARSGGKVAVQGEVKSSDRVVTTGAYGLSDGMHVVPAAEAAAPGDSP
jgi:membrane fusion protein (multidrug efflux system)